MEIFDKFGWIQDSFYYTSRFQFISAEEEKFIKLSYKKDMKTKHENMKKTEFFLLINCEFQF